MSVSYSKKTAKESLPFISILFCYLFIFTISFDLNGSWKCSLNWWNPLSLVVVLFITVWFIFDGLRMGILESIALFEKPTSKTFWKAPRK